MKLIETKKTYLLYNIYNISLHLVEKYINVQLVQIVSQLNEYDDTELKKYLLNIKSIICH